MTPDPSALRLFIPGPTHVRPRILAAQARPMISHRGGAMKELLAQVLPAVRAALGTEGDAVVLSTSSTQAMESVGRSVTRPGKRVLHLVNGNFSNLWYELSVASGLDAERVEKPWGDAWDEASAGEALQRAGAVDAVFVAQCETSTGALSDIAGVARAVRAVQPEALVCVDVTSSAAGVPVRLDEDDLDIAVGGVQKAWALPPALALGAVSARARSRMKDVPARGYANDMLSALEYQESKEMTATTPAIPVMQALALQWQDIQSAGGFAARWQKHRAMQRSVLDWCAARGLDILARDGFRSPTVTAIATGGRFVTADLVAGYKARGFFLGAGYGKTRDTHWRIGHMGDHTPQCVRELLAATDAVLAEISGG